MPPSRQKPRNITYPRKQEKSPEWAEYASYPNIVKHWKELDEKVKQAERVARYSQIAAVIGWVILLIVSLILAAH